MSNINKHLIKIKLGSLLQRFPKTSTPVYARLEQLPHVSCKMSQTGCFEIPFHFGVYAPLEELPSRCLTPQPAPFSCCLGKCQGPSRYNKIACRRWRRPTLEHLFSLAANGPLESPAAEATSLSKLKVLLAKYNLITYTHCHYNLTRKNSFNLRHQERSRQKSVWETHYTAPRNCGRSVIAL